MPHNPFLEIIRANPQIRWLYHALSINPNITWEIVKAVKYISKKLHPRNLYVLTL
jgi:hypothetical protein